MQPPHAFRPLVSPATHLPGFALPSSSSLAANTNACCGYDQPPRMTPCGIMCRGVGIGPLQRRGKHRKRRAEAGTGLRRRTRSDKRNHIHHRCWYKATDLGAAHFPCKTMHRRLQRWLRTGPAATLLGAPGLRHNLARAIWFQLRIWPGNRSDQGRIPPTGAPGCRERSEQGPWRGVANGANRSRTGVLRTWRTGSAPGGPERRQRQGVANGTKMGGAGCCEQGRPGLSRTGRTGSAPGCREQRPRRRSRTWAALGCSEQDPRLISALRNRLRPAALKLEPPSVAPSPPGTARPVADTVRSGATPATGSPRRAGVSVTASLPPDHDSVRSAQPLPQRALGRSLRRPSQPGILGGLGLQGRGGASRGMGHGPRPSELGRVPGDVGRGRGGGPRPGIWSAAVRNGPRPWRWAATVGDGP